MTLQKIKCSHCHETYEYEDDGVTMDCLPDGVFPHCGPDWLCDDCMTCSECGCSCFADECDCDWGCEKHGPTYKEESHE